MDLSNPCSIDYIASNQKYYENLPSVKGIPYEGISCLKDMGFQASKLYEAYTSLKYAIEKNYSIILAFTSNVITSGLRDLIVQLCKLKLVNCIITTGGAIEEDLIKSKVAFKYLNRAIDDSLLHEYGLNRTENILCPNLGYVWLQNLLKKLGQEDPGFYQSTPIAFVQQLSKVAKEDSFLYWSLQNKILVIPLCLEDGAIGDHLAIKTYDSLMKKEKPPVLNSVSNLYSYFRFLHTDTPKCVIALGGGSPKHFAMNGLISSGGADMTLYFNNETTTDGSNASAPVEEAISWGKSKPNSMNLRVHGDFMFTFYLLASQLIKDLGS